LGRSAYTYFHMPIVAGIIVSAAADGIVIAHPPDEATVATTAVVLGGPMLYLVGIMLFKLALWGHVSQSRLVAIGALVALIPLAAVSSVLMLTAAATAVLVGLALWDVYAERRAQTAPTEPSGVVIEEAER
jgi:low temperature requirement protein LtrA